MKKFLRFALCFLVLSSVRSHIIYRNFRELNIPQGEQIISKQDELVQNLQKESSIPVTVEIIEPVAVLVSKPSENEKNLAIEAVIAQESAVISGNEILPQQEINNEIKDEEQKVLEKTENLEQLKPEKEKNLSDQKSDLKESNLKPEKEQIDDKFSSEKVEEVRLDETKKDELSNDSDKKDKLSENSDKNTDELRQNEPTQTQQSQPTTQRPTIFQAAQQAISNSPIGQFIDSFRRPLSPSSTNSPISDQTQLVVTVPNLLQQFQAGVQNLTNQFTSVFNPNQVQAADDGSTTRPTIIQTLQSNLQNAVNTVFRPLTVNVTTTGITPQNPLQVVLNPLQAVQNFLSGNRGESSTSARPITVVTQQLNSQVTSKPISSTTVDDKVDYNLKNSQEEVVDSDEEEEQEDSEENSNSSNNEADEQQQQQDQQQQQQQQEQQQQQYPAINENQIIQELAAQL